jgi:hypothetical protein
LFLSLSALLTPSIVLDIIFLQETKLLAMVAKVHHHIGDAREIDPPQSPIVVIRITYLGVGQQLVKYASAK